MGDDTLIRPRVVGRLSSPAQHAVEPMPIAKGLELTSSNSAFSIYDSSTATVLKELATNGTSHQSLLTKATVAVVNTYKHCRTALTSQPQQNSTTQSKVLTKPSMGVHNYGYDNENCDLIIKVDDVFISNSGLRYIVRDMLGQGTFGQVAKCFCEQTQEVVALKVIKNQSAYYHQARVEIGVLQYLNRSADPDDRYHIVRLRDFFLFRNHLCLVFELLSVNLYELIKHNHFQGLSMHLVRVFIQQILETLIVLRNSNIIHCDLKPENVLLKGLDTGDIKVIDFGSACFENKTVYSYIQSRFYRSPEVVLGYPYTVAIDMWSLGCMTAELFLGLPLFPGASEHDLMSRVVETLGIPPPFVLDRAKHTSKYFKKVDKIINIGGLTAVQSQYCLRSATEFEAVTRQKATIGKRYFKGAKLVDIVFSYPSRQASSAAEVFQDKVQRESLLDFLHGVLNLDPESRWTPQQAIQHPFITNQPFHGHFEPPREAQTVRGNSVALPSQPGSFNTSQQSWRRSTSQVEAATLLATSPHVQAHVAAMAALQAHLSPQMLTPRSGAVAGLGNDVTGSSSYPKCNASSTMGSGSYQQGSLASGSFQPNSVQAIAAAAAAAAAASYGSYPYNTLGPGPGPNQVGYSPASGMQIDQQPFFTPTGSLRGGGLQRGNSNNLANSQSTATDMQFSPMNHSFSTYQLAAAAAVAAANAAAAAVGSVPKASGASTGRALQQPGSLQNQHLFDFQQLQNQNENQNQHQIPGRMGSGLTSSLTQYVTAAKADAAGVDAASRGGYMAAQLQRWDNEAAVQMTGGGTEQRLDAGQALGRGNVGASQAEAVRATSLDQSMAFTNNVVHEESVSPSPGDWDPLYSDELLLAEDTGRAAKKQCDEQKTFSSPSSQVQQLSSLGLTSLQASLLGQALLNGASTTLTRNNNGVAPTTLGQLYPTAAPSSLSLQLHNNMLSAARLDPSRMDSSAHTQQPFLPSDPRYPSAERPAQRVGNYPDQPSVHASPQRPTQSGGYTSGPPVGPSRATNPWQSTHLQQHSAACLAQPLNPFATTGGGSRDHWTAGSGVLPSPSTVLPTNPNALFSSSLAFNDQYTGMSNRGGKTASGACGGEMGPDALLALAKQQLQAQGQAGGMWQAASNMQELPVAPAPASVPLGSSSLLASSEAPTNLPVPPLPSSSANTPHHPPTTFSCLSASLQKGQQAMPTVKSQHKG